MVDFNYYILVSHAVEQGLVAGHEADVQADEHLELRPADTELVASAAGGGVCP